MAAHATASRMSAQPAQPPSCPALPAPPPPSLTLSLPLSLPATTCRSRRSTTNCCICVHDAQLRVCQHPLLSILSPLSPLLPLPSLTQLAQFQFHCPFALPCLPSALHFPFSALLLFFFSFPAKSQRLMFCLAASQWQVAPSSPLSPLRCSYCPAAWPIPPENAHRACAPVESVCVCVFRFSPFVLP